jgi:hypothetical protein
MSRGGDKKGKKGETSDNYLNKKVVQMLELVDPNTNVILPPDNFRMPVDGFDSNGNPFRPQGITGISTDGKAEKVVNGRMFILYKCFCLFWRLILL